MTIFMESGLVLAQLLGVPGICGFFRSYCLAPDAPAWIFADQLTLFKAGGADHAHHITTWHPRLQNQALGVVM